MQSSFPMNPTADLMKQEMLQTMVHDLRAPITVIKGNLLILLSGMMGQMSAEQKMLLERSVGPLEEMIQLTDNLLQASKLDQENVSLQRSRTDLDRLLTDTIEFYELPFRQRHMQIFRDGNTLGVQMNVDAFWIKRVLHNLIWNAFKYTPDSGQVALKVNHRGQGLELVIEDTGCGIPAGKLRAIFEKFGQANSKDRTTGTGLGLWISKKVLELHGGEIRCESQPGKGSRFILYFPPNCIL